MDTIGKACSTLGELELSTRF